jgi:hypothetical protein
MNNSFERLIDGMTATLRSEVLTRLDDEFARGQVFGVINLLNNMRIRADWSVNFLHEEVNAQRQALSAAQESLAKQGLSLPSFQGRAMTTESLSPTLDAANLLQLREEGNAALQAVLHWLWSKPSGLEAQQIGEIESAVRRAMRTEVELEIRHLAKPMFAEMSQGSE